MNVECDEILDNWKMSSQSLNNKERYFLDLLNNNLNFIELTYSKGGLWLKFFDYSNSLYARAVRAITNYILIRKYQLRFFLQKFFCVLINSI